jgi:hypothetical protein
MYNACFFSGFTNWPSAQVRCHQPAEALGLPVYTKLSEIPKGMEFFITVKADRFLKDLQKRGRVIWDVVDEMPPVNCDYYIACTEHAADYIRKYIGNKRVFVVPQHHCNIDNLPFVEPSDVATWVGSTAWYPGDLGFPYQRYDSPNVLTLKSVQAIYSRTGIGLNIRNKNSPNYNTHVHLNAGGKLANCIGFGIPSISDPEPSYKAMSNCTLFIGEKTPKELYEELRDEKVYKSLQEACRDEEPKRRLSFTVNCYKEMLHEVSKSLRLKVPF